jgi:hypothetical protein
MLKIALFVLLVFGFSGGSVLSTAAAGLSPGQYADTPELANPYSNSLDIQWMTICAYYDTIHNEIQYMGKWASGQDGTGKFYHYNYDEAANTWHRPLAGPLIGSGTTGHIWETAFDFATGDYWIQCFGKEFLCRFNRAAWDSAGRPDGVPGEVPSWWSFRTGTADILYSSATVLNGMALHPNLFGAGDKGIAVAGAIYIWGYRLSTDTWHQLSRDFYSEPVMGGGFAGAGWYIPSADAVVVGGDRQARSGAFNAMWRVPAGSGGIHPKTSEFGALTPIAVYGGSGDPCNPNRLLIMETGGESRVWASDDLGQSWVLQGYTHPFRGMGTASWTACSLTRYGVIWGLKSDRGFLGRLWRPPAQGTGREISGPGQGQGLPLAAAPNPFRSSIRISMPSPAALKVFDMRGKVLASFEGVKDVEWDASGMPSGIYILKADRGDRIHTKQLFLSK